MMEDAATEQLSAYLDGELTDAEVTELEHRLALDPALQSELDQLRGAIDLLRTHGPTQTPPSLYGDLLAAVADEPMPGGFWTWLQRPFGLPLPALAVAFVAVLVLGVTVTGAMVLGGEEALRPAVSKNPLASSWSEKDSKPRDMKKPDVQRKSSDKSVAEKTVAGAKGGQTYAGEADDVGNMDLVVPGTAEEEGSLNNQMSKLKPTSEQIEDVEGTPAETKAVLGGTSDDDMEISGGSSVYSVGLRGEDLEDVASLYQRYAGTSKTSSIKAQQIANLEPGTHQITLTLPKGADRNAFKQDLERRHPGTFKEIITTDDTITLDNTVVTLRLTVSKYLPGSRGTSIPPVSTIREEEASEPRDVPASKQQSLPHKTPRH